MAAVNVGRTLCVLPPVPSDADHAGDRSVPQASRFPWYISISNLLPLSSNFYVLSFLTWQKMTRTEY